MEAIILAGGLGTRLRSVLVDVPKPMAPVAGQPFIQILIRALARRGFTRVVLSLGYMAEKVIDLLGQRYEGVELAYEVEDIPLGTGGAIRASLNQCTNDSVFVFNGDTFLDLEVEAVVQQWTANGRPIVVARQVPDRARFGTIVVENGRIVEFAEKTHSGPGLINAGCYVFPRNLLSSVSQDSFSVESDFLKKEVHRQDFEVFVSNGLFIDIGVPSELARAQTLLDHYL